ncbi:MAG: hypothetical protein KJ558_17135 [Gammaproteobacteria bacterium]|nr:hypothetical protein [Gammaproteobacteria bacterium]MBU1962868.1 hypothetical protein [Gammaproteobacteria bacterium]
MTVAALSGTAFGAAFHRTRPATGPVLDPDQHAAALTLNELRAREANSLAPAGDIAAANAAHDAHIHAWRQMEAGGPVSVAGRAAVEQGRLIAAWDRVHDAPLGSADDPLVRLTPENLCEVLVARGDAWLGRDGLTIRTGREGLVKIIIRHGPASGDAHPVAREDVASLPLLLRQFEPFLETGKTGRPERTWVIGREEGGPLVIVVKETAKDDRNRLITMYVDDRNPARPLSGQRQGRAPESVPPGRAGHAAEDTAPEAFSRPPGSRKPDLDSTIAQGPDTLGGFPDPVGPPSGGQAARPPATPEQARAGGIAQRYPELAVPLGELDGDGSPLSARAADLWAHADEIEATAQREAGAFMAAVECALRLPL